MSGKLCRSAGDIRKRESILLMIDGQHVRCVPTWHELLGIWATRFPMEGGVEREVRTSWGGQRPCRSLEMDSVFLDNILPPSCRVPNSWGFPGVSLLATSPDWIEGTRWGQARTEEGWSWGVRRMEKKRTRVQVEFRIERHVSTITGFCGNLTGSRPCGPWHEKVFQSVYP